MKLIIGGSFQGKTKYAQSLLSRTDDIMINGEDCSLEDIFDAKCINHFHLYVKRFLYEEKLDAIIDELSEKNPDILIVTDEIGYGIVPIDPEERAWREKTGRICCHLAQESDSVFRLVAGIPVKIK